MFTKAISILGAGLFTLGLWSSNAHAAISCQIAVTQIDIAGSGGVFITGSAAGANFDHDVLCSVSAPMGQYTVEACKALHKNLVSALLSGKKVNLWFNGNGATCTPPAWTDLSASSFGFYHSNIVK